MTLDSYSYDFPMSSTTTPSCSPYSASIKVSIKPHHRRASKEASRAADITRILDPSYNSSASLTTPRKSSFATTTPPNCFPVSAYVDPDGDLHDPDYRDFPTLVLDEDDSRGGRSADDDDELSSTEANTEWAPAVFASERKRRLTEASVNSIGRYSPREQHTYGSLPSSSPLAADKPFKEKEHTHSHTPTSFVHRYRCRHSSASISTPPSLSITPALPSSRSQFDEMDHEAAQSTASLPQYIDNSLLSAGAALTRVSSTPNSAPAHVAVHSPLALNAESTSSPSPHHESHRHHSHREALKRQWQAVSMRVRFGVFRAGRRWGVV